MTNKEQIIALEKKLLEAFADKNLTVIDELLHEDSLFIYPNGQTVTKPMVLDNYRHGNSEFTTIISSDEIIHCIDDTAVVSLNLALQGKYFEETISAQFRYSQ